MFQKSHIFSIALFVSTVSFAQSYAPPAGQAGTTAIHFDSSVFVAWATGVEVQRGYIQISDTTKYHEGSNRASFGTSEIALGKPSGTNTDAVSLGDGGWAIVTFDGIIYNGESWDFAIFENGISDTFLELAFVEVSSDGEHYFRFPAHTEVQNATQIDGFESIDCRYINNFAGKYRNTFGTPFDLDDIPDTNLLDKNAVRYVKIIDVVGSINANYATHDAFGNIVNDPFPTPFYSSGFDLTGVGAIHFTEQLNTNEIAKNNTLVYPTIFFDKLTIVAPSEFNYTISTISGEIIQNGKFFSSNNVLELNHLQQGMYFLTVQTSERIQVFSVIKGSGF